MVDFIEDHRAVYGVEPICAVLPIAPATYYEQRARRRDPELRPERAKRDERPRVEIRRVWQQSHEGVYGADKVWRQLGREGFAVARCTVLMRAMGLRGAVRGRAFAITTQADQAAQRPPDLVERDFQASRPNQLWVADLTYVATWAGFVYVALRGGVRPPARAASGRLPATHGLPEDSLSDLSVFPPHRPSAAFSSAFADCGPAPSAWGSRRARPGQV